MSSDAGKSQLISTPYILNHAEGTCRVITLNRPRALHTLNLDMVQSISNALQVWEKDNNCQVVILKASPIDGKYVYCAGGDVVALVKNLNYKKAGDRVSREEIEFLYTEYALNHYLATYSKPIIAIIDGIVMGGGAGVSIHAPFRIATERTVFAMPETAIGYFPDVGASFFLSRLMDHHLGIYLGMTGARLYGHDVYHAGIATHFVQSSLLEDAQRSLQNVNSAESIINMLDTFAPDTLEPFSLEAVLPTIKDCFSLPTVQEIVERVKGHQQNSNPSISSWAKETYSQLSTSSPAALMVTLMMLRKATSLSLKNCLRMEIGLAHQFTSNSFLDFRTGVTAKLIDKTNRPQWDPPTLEKTDLAKIKALFMESRDLDFINNIDFQQYPHIDHSMPSTKRILEYLQSQNPSKTKQSDLLENTCKHWNNRPGLRTKVQQLLLQNYQ